MFPTSPQQGVIDGPPCTTAIKHVDETCEGLCVFLRVSDVVFKEVLLCVSCDVTIVGLRGSCSATVAQTLDFDLLRTDFCI